MLSADDFKFSHSRPTNFLHILLSSRPASPPDGWANQGATPSGRWQGARAAAANERALIDRKCTICSLLSSSCVCEREEAGGQHKLPI
jgi:hypothetical protein